jgi:hypothetical protein
MVCTTGTALTLNFLKFLRDYRISPQTMLLTNMSIAVLLFLLGALVVFEGVRVVRMSRRPAADV